jgi:hypothetical protein
MGARGAQLEGQREGRGLHLTLTGKRGRGSNPPPLLFENGDMAEFLDFDPVTGIAHYFDHDEMTNETRITYVQDVQPLLDYTRAMANDGATDQGIKKGWWLYAKIPPIVQVKMKAKGIDINDPKATQRIIQEINEHYPALKCTQKNDGKRAATQIYLPDAD